MSSIVPTTPGLKIGRAEHRRIRVDEADDLDAKLVAAIVELAGKADRRRACADQQQTLARPDAAENSNATRQPITSVMTRKAAIMNTPRPRSAPGTRSRARRAGTRRRRAPG